VNFLAFNVCKNRHIYKQYQQVTTVDFSDIDTLNEGQLKQFRSEDLINPRPAIFEGVGGAGTEELTAGVNPEAGVIHKRVQQTQQGFFSRLGRRVSRAISGADEMALSSDSDEGEGHSSWGATAAVAPSTRRGGAAAEEGGAREWPKDAGSAAGATRPAPAAHTSRTARVKRAAKRTSRLGGSPQTRLEMGPMRVSRSNPLHSAIGHE
jgi:hypothetical protein